MGAFHSGLLNKLKSFRECLSDPILCKIKGCVKPSQKYTQGKWEEYPIVEIPIRGVLYRFFRHPELYLDPAISVIIAEANHDIDRGAVGAFNKIGAKDKDAYDMYRDALDACRKLKDILDAWF